MLLPIRSKNPPESLPILTILLIVANTFVFFMTSNGFEVRESVVEAWGLKGATFDWLRAFTSMFLHGDILHLAGNMWFLYLFGFAVEGRLRSFKFGLLYLGAGLAGDLLHFALLGAANPDIPSIGASGAIMGVLGAGMYLFPHGKVTFFALFYYVNVHTWEWPMWCVGLMYVALDLFPALLALEDGVAHFAHLGGIGAGFLIAFAIRAQRDSQMASEAKAMLSDTEDLSVLSRPELAELHRTNPNDTAVALNWVYRSMRDSRGVTDECRAAFFRLLPKILQDEEIGPVATCVGFFAMDAGAVSPRVLFEVASRLERSYDNPGALRLYEMLDRDPNATDADREAAFFRMAMISETAMGNVDRAMHTYQTIIDRWPYGPFADQSKVRLAALANRTI